MAWVAGIESGNVTARDAAEKRSVPLAVRLGRIEELLLACLLLILLDRLRTFQGGVFAVSPALFLLLNRGKRSGLKKNKLLALVFFIFFCFLFFIFLSFYISLYYAIFSPY